MFSMLLNGGKGQLHAFTLPSVDLRAGLVTEGEKKKKSCPCLESNCDFSFDVCGSVHLDNICFYSIPTGCTICFIYFLKNFNLYMFRMLFAPISSQCTAIGFYGFYGFGVFYGFYGFGVFYSIEQVLVLGHFDTLARSVIL
jgi:hypothetical protein